uniref:Uncharacterized protein n=1 Tax=Bionectria ochroleuca TaxID=29856 RepID=A0A8H7KBD2_BIOOC
MFAFVSSFLLPPSPAIHSPSNIQPPGPIYINAQRVYLFTYSPLVARLTAATQRQPDRSWTILPPTHKAAKTRNPGFSSANLSFRWLKGRVSHASAAPISWLLWPFTVASRVLLTPPSTQPPPGSNQEAI